MSSDSAVQPGVAADVDFALRRVNISTALDPSYSLKISLSFVAFLFSAAVAADRFEGRILGQLIPFVLATLLIAVPVFLYSGGTIIRRGSTDQGRWVPQVLIGDPILDAFRAVSAYPLRAFVAISVLAEATKVFGSMYAIALAAAVTVAVRAACNCKGKCAKANKQ